MSKFTNSLKGAARGVKRSPKAVVRLAGRTVRAVLHAVHTAVVWAIALPMIFKQHRAAKVAAEKEAQAFVDEVFATFDVENFTDHSASYDEDLTYTFVDENDIEVVLTVSNEDAPKEAADREPLKRVVRSEVCKSFQDEAEAATDSKRTSYWFGATQAALAKEMGENLKKAWAFLWKTVNVPDSAFIPKKVREGWNDELATAYELLHA